MSRPTRVVTGLLLIAVPVLFNVFFTLLSMEFSYPDVLRDPSAEILRRFDEGGTFLVALWYGFALTPALFLPAALLLRRAFPDDSTLLSWSVPFAVLASVTQLLGLVRWPFLVPHLSDTYLDPNGSDASREAALVTFEAFHRYAGVAVGEHLGYLFTAGWTVTIAAAMLMGSRFPGWLGWVGTVAAVGIAIGMVEPAGFDAAGAVNAIAYIVWSLWLAVIGILLLRSREDAPTTDRAPTGLEHSAPSFGT